MFVVAAKDDVIFCEKTKGEKMFGIVSLRCTKNLQAPMKTTSVKGS